MRLITKILFFWIVFELLSISPVMAEPPTLIKAINRIINQSSGYCLDDGTAKNGGEVRMWECAGHPNQVWVVFESGLENNFFYLKNQASNFCLDTDGSKKNGGTVRVWECANHPNQLWEVHTLPSGRYRFKNKASGFCLDTDGKAANGGNVHMRECADHPNQSWFGTLPLVSAKTADQLINHSSSYCLDTNGAAKNGGEVRMWECAGHPNQVWTVEQATSSIFRLRNQASNFCLDTDGSKKNGGTVRVWECANHPNQLWEVHTLPSGRYRFKNKASGFCLDTDGKAANGGNVHMWECADHPNQSWFGNSRVIDSITVHCGKGNVFITGELKNYSNLSVTYNNKFIGLNKVGKCLKYDDSSCKGKKEQGIICFPPCLQWAPPEPEVTIGDPVSVPAKGSATFEIGPIYKINCDPDSKVEIQRSSLPPLSVQLSWDGMHCIQ